jgi:hypothetical protein
VLGTIASAWGLAVAVGDTEGENPIAWLMFAGPALAGAFPTLELAWRRDRDLSMSTVQSRWFIFPLFGALGAIVAMVITEIVMRVSGAVAAAQARDPYHYWFAEDGPPFPSFMFGILGYVAGLLLALAFFVVVLWPLQVLLRPRQALEENMMDGSEANFRRNRAALLMMPLIVINAVVLAIALTAGIGWLALLSVLLEVAMVVVTMFLQRADKKRRSQAGLPTGIELGHKKPSRPERRTLY